MYFLCPALLTLLVAQHPLPVDDTDWAEAAANVFLEDEVTQITVTMAESDLDSFISNPYIDTYTSCSVRIVNSILDETHLDVGIRPRGNSQRNSKKFPWKLSFNEFVVGRKFHGVEKMNLASESTDPSLARETLSYEIARSVGLPAGRTNYVWLTINDGTKIQGVYNNIEQVDEEFVQAWFGNKDGELYKCRWKDQGAKLLWIAPGDPATYEALDDYEEKIGNRFQRLADFISFINLSDSATFRAEIGDWLNVDGFLRAQSLDMVMGQWDGSWILPNNFYLYWDTDTSRFEYIPWDLDHCMGMDYFFFPYFWGTDWARRPFANWGLGGPASDPGNGNGPPLIDRLLKIPEYENQMKMYARAFAADNAHPTRLTPSCERIFKLLRPLAFQGTFSGSSMENGYVPSDFLNSWEFPPSYRATNTPATWGVLPYLRTRSQYIRDQYPIPNALPVAVINEVLTKNENGILDEAGENEDWVEIHNASDQPLDLSGFFLSDRYADPHQWMIPAGTVIPARDYALIWCDEDITQGPLHASFKLSNSGEGVYLFAPDNGLDILVSSLLVPAIPADSSFGRVPDGRLTTTSFSSPTPLALNQPDSFTLVLEGLVPDGLEVFSVGGTPNGQVAFLYSRKPGSFTLGSGTPCPGVTLDLGVPVSLGVILPSSPEGIASASLLPNTAQTGLNLQAIDLGSCAVSNLLEL